MENLVLTKINFMNYLDPATGNQIPREGNVVIPKVVVDKNGNEYQIVEIGSSVFAGYENLTTITIPDSVTKIEDRAFQDCKSLTSITIPESVTYIGSSAFSRCKSLTSITIPESVTYINNEVFYGCENLTSITIPDSVTKIRFGMFAGCENLTSITIPESVTCIENEAFHGCENLTSITISDSVTEIGMDAFYGCSNLTSITIPESVTCIGDSAFYDCKSLTSITIPDSITEIRNGAFANCKSLTSITIPESVTYINNEVFYGCENLTSITIPDSVTKIEGYAFSGCSDDLVITYRGHDYIRGNLNMLSEQSDGLGILACMNIMSDAADILGDNSYSPVLMSKLINAEHNGSLEETYEKIKQDFQTIGFYEISSKVDVEAKDRLTTLFKENATTRGVVPKIIDALTIASTELGIPEEKIVAAFEDRKFRDAVTAMRSCHEGNRFFDVEAALFAMNFDVNTVKNVILENPHKDYASLLLCEGYQKNDEHLLDLAKWIGCHPDVSQDIVKDIVQYRSSITLDISDNVDTVRAQLSKGEAELEIREIENDYDGFKFSECVCRLPKTEADLGDYKAYIMDGQDPRQVMIGYDTDCCQHYGGAGETAMMYGLANPDAGFFVIEDKDTGKILAQAEVWERTTKSGNKQLVFDNIEFADDRQIDQFAPVLAKWCENAPYDKILMGNGYNEMENSELRHHKGVEPPMTDELYDLFDGDEPYTDADEDCSILKAKGEVEPYLTQAYDRYMKDHQEEHSLFSEPTEEEFEEFRHDEPEQDKFVMVDGVRSEDIEDPVADRDTSDQREDMDQDNDDRDEEDIGDLD